MAEYKEFWPPGAFLKHLTDRLEIPRRRPVETVADFETYTLDLTALKLNVGFFTPFLVSRRLSAHTRITAMQLDELLPQLHDRVRETKATFVALVVGGKIDDEDLVIQRFGPKLVAVISHPTIEAVMNAAAREKAWQSLSMPLVRYLGRQTLSPYRPGKPAHAGRFFGRVEALAQATSGGKLGGNFTLVGNRRIGKTSLLREIKARLIRDNARLRTADVYGNNYHSSHAVVKELLVHLRPDLERRLDAEPQLVDNLPAHISWLPEKNNEDVAVFIDELDHILEFDAKQDYKLLNLLRATFEHERCRIFLAGFRRVIDAKSHLDTPLHNFTQWLPVTSLTKHETHEMITGPFSRLGIDLPPGLPEVIMHETSGHPELVQMFCSKVIEYYDAHEQAPGADELVAGIVEDDVFRQKVYTAFLSNTNPLERLACYGLIAWASTLRESVERFQFTLENVDEVMTQFGYPQKLENLNLLAENLKLGGVIGQVRGMRTRSFRFAVPRLAEYCIADDLNFTIRKTKEELETTPEPITILMDTEHGFDDSDEI